MSTTTIEKDEDLIILNSDTEHDDIFNFGETINAQEQSTQDVSDVIIDFGSDEVSEVKIDNISTESKVEEPMSSDFDFSFDFNESKAEETPAITLDEPKNEEISSLTFEEPKAEETVSFIEEVKEEIIPPTSFSAPSISEITPVKEEVITTFDTDLGDVNSILDQTIAKLNSRKDVISGQKSTKSAKITDLEAQIKKLQEEVAMYSGEIEDLEVELKKIDKNISSIEKMKNDSLEIVTDRQRQHNLSNIKKTK